MEEFGSSRRDPSHVREVTQEKHPKEALPAIKSLLWERTRQNNLETLDAQRIAQFKDTPITIDASLYDNYRQYYDHPESESYEPLVVLEDFGIKSQDVYYKYSKSSLEDVMKISKSNTLLIPDIQKIVQPLNEIDGKALQFDEFYALSQLDQINILRSIGGKLGYNLQEVLGAGDIQKIQNTFSLYFGNQKLKNVVPKDGKNQVREEIGKALREINQKLIPLGYSIGVDTGYRSISEQIVIKENHTRTYGRVAAEKLYADIGKSAHHTGGALDMLLFDANGKEINLRIGDNSPKTKELLYGESLILAGDDVSVKDREAIEMRRLLYYTMTSNGFIPLITEYWHFGWGDRLSRHIESKRSGIIIPAQYGNK